jgi:hypothetical protein
MLRYAAFFGRLLEILSKNYNGWSHSVLSIMALAAKNVFLSHIEGARLRLKERFMQENFSEEELNFFSALSDAFALMPKESHGEMCNIIRKAMRS